MLLNPRYGSKMCCMGFFSLESGVSKEEISGKQAIEILDRKYTGKLWDNSCSTYEDDVLAEIYGVNDDERFSDEERERRLTELFKERNVTVHFVGEYL